MIQMDSGGGRPRKMSYTNFSDATRTPPMFEYLAHFGKSVV